MIIKLTTAFVVTAALLCGTAQADFLQCSKTSDKANIIGVDAWSTSDLGDVDRHAGMDVPYADIVLTRKCGTRLVWCSILFELKVAKYDFCSCLL